MMIQDVLASFQQTDPAAAVPLLRALRTEFVQRRKALVSDELRLFTETVLALLPKVTILERMAFARATADSPYLPLPVMERLLADAAMVAAPLLERNPNCPDANLIRMAETASEAQLLALAARKPLRAAVAAYVHEISTQKVRHVLAANVDAELSFDLLNALIDEAVEDGDMDKCLANRPDLPPELAAKLHKIVSARTRSRVSAMVERDIQMGKSKGIRFFMPRT